MEESKDSYKREYRNVTIRTIDGTTLIGKVNIGIKERVSDLFTKTENPFIVLFDVEDRDISGKVLFINKNNIVWVEPED
jgi:small nuclear ribonucleoprotein (snRNP)-like protein